MSNRNDTIKYILCDFDGVLCKLDLEAAIDKIVGSSHELLLSPLDLIRSYFYVNPYYKEIDSGEITYEEMLSLILPLCWRGSRSSWLNLWVKIWDCYKTDEVLLDFLIFRSKLGTQIRVVTDNHLSFRSWFASRNEFKELESNLICSSEVGHCKPSKQIFELAIGHTSSNFSAACLIDDSHFTISEAEKYGMLTILHESTFNTMNKLHFIFNEERC